MSPSTYTMRLPGSILVRGFWLYVWKIETPDGLVLYVGRTGDNSTPNAASPIARMGQHLSKNPQQNMLRRHLEKRGHLLEHCDVFDLVTYGPLFPETPDWDEHRPRRDKIAALERELAQALKGAGYDVLNAVRSRHEVDADLWDKTLKAFAVHLPQMG